MDGSHLHIINCNAMQSMYCFLLQKHFLFSAAASVYVIDLKHKYSGTSQLRHHSGSKIYVVKQRRRCLEVFKMAVKLTCCDFRRTIKHRPMEVQTK